MPSLPANGVKKKYLTLLSLYSKIPTVGWQEGYLRQSKHCRGQEQMDRIYEQTMLFDFYGELLTEHQRAVYADAVYNDLSLGEIAEERGISRQGVHDLIKRCDRILREYESRLHLVERFARAKETVRKIQELSATDKGESAWAEESEDTAADGCGIKRNSCGNGSCISGAGMPLQTEDDLRERLCCISRLSQELLEEL